MADVIIQLIENQLKKYYESVNAIYTINKEGAGLFAEYCEENGIDGDSIEDEFNEDPSDSILTDFDDEFPLHPPPKNDEEKAQRIFDLIKLCSQQNAVFDVAAPKIDRNAYENITANDVKNIRDLYKKQCPAIYDAGMEDDVAFSKIAAIGYKQNCDYLQHLVDAYFRESVDVMPKSLDVPAWADTHKHFRELKNWSNANSKSNPFQMAKTAVSSFNTRGCTKMMFTNPVAINDSLESTVRYIASVIEWVGTMAKTEKSGAATCPFQVDLCIGFDVPSSTESMEGLGNDEDDDDDDDFDEKDVTAKKGDLKDVIGNIKERLEQNKLKYAFSDNKNVKEPSARLFGEIYKEYKGKLDAKEKKQYPHRSRWVTFVDRRKDSGDIWMYHPPNDCRNIPKVPVPEWYISASKTCLLPNMKYAEGRAAEASVKNKNGNNKGNIADKAAFLLKKNIQSTSHCHGMVLTVSIIAKEENVIKVYLYHYGQIIRFEAEDIKTVLPKLFSMEWDNGANEKFLANTQTVNGLINKMKKVMIDKPFMAFVQKYK